MLKRSSRERNAEDTEEAKTKNYLGKKKKSKVELLQN